MEEKKKKKTNSKINNKKKDIVESLYELTNFEIEHLNDMAICGCVKTANFPYQKTLEDYDFSFQPSVNKDVLMEFKNLRFLICRRN